MPDFGGAIFTVVAWAVLGLIVAIPVMQILRGWAEGTVDPLMGVALVGTILTLLALTWQTAGTLWMLLFVGLLLATCAAGPFLTVYLDRRAHREMRHEDIEKYRRAIELDPDNASAHAFLGDAFMQSKTYAAAIAQYERAVALSQEHAARSGNAVEHGNPALETWKRKLQKARDAQAGVEHATRLIVCTCGQENSHERKKCERCGARLQIGFGK